MNEDRSEIVDLEKTSPDKTGKVVEEESYCPASPAPTKTNLSFPYSSPVFSKNKTSTMRMNPMIL